MTAISTLVPHQTLASFCAACFKKLGLPPADARITADNLVFANLRGVDSHGVIRLKAYGDRLRAGGFRAGVRARTLSETLSCAALDAGGGVGQVAGVAAMDLAIAKAKTTGVGLVTVKNTNHFGAAAFFAVRALKHGMIGCAATNAGATMAPTGGRERRLGNNPIAIAVPAQKHPPIILDMATGAVALGKIFVAQQEKKKIPAAWALDKQGLPTDDPNKAADGGLIQPMGGYKGYGLSFLIDILTGVLSGGGFSTRVKTLYQDLGSPAEVAQTFCALSVGTFMTPVKFRRRVDEIIDLMHSCAPAPGANRVYVPGEIEFENERRRKAEGIPLNSTLREELLAFGAELSVAPVF